MCVCVLRELQEGREESVLRSSNRMSFRHPSSNSDPSTAYYDILMWSIHCQSRRGCVSVYASLSRLQCHAMPEPQVSAPYTADEDLKTRDAQVGHSSETINQHIVPIHRRRLSSVSQFSQFGTNISPLSTNSATHL